MTKTDGTITGREKKSKRKKEKKREGEERKRKVTCTRDII
jgi:hypothetical protein